LRSFFAGLAGAGHGGHAGQGGQGGQVFSGGQTTAGGHAGQGGHAGAGGTTLAGAGGGVSPFFASWKQPHPPKDNPKTRVNARITTKPCLINMSSF